MKNNNLLSVVALVLVISAIAGLFILVFSMYDSGVFGEALSDGTASDGEETGDVGGDSNGVDEPENSDTFYLNSGSNTGYVIHGNKTYFFKRFQYPSDKPYGHFSLMSKFDSSDYDVEMAWTKNPLYEGSFEYDDTDPTDLYGKSNITVYHREVSTDWVYVIALSLSDCENPEYWLESLNQSFFGDSESFRVNFANAAG